MGTTGRVRRRGDHGEGAQVRRGDLGEGAQVRCGDHGEGAQAWGPQGGQAGVGTTVVWCGANTVSQGSLVLILRKQYHENMV